MQKSQIFTYLYNTVIVLLLLAGITYVVLQFTHFGHIEYTDNARVCQYIAPQNTRVQGFIKEIRFEAYQHVREGDTLVIIEDSEFRLRLAQAKSDLARAQQQSKQAGSSVRTASSNISATEASKAEAKANLDNLAREDKRCEQLLRTGSVSQQIADQTHSAYLAAQARYEQICHTIDMQRSMADETSHNRSAVEAAVKLAEAAVDAVCNFITMRTTNMAILLPVCFLAGVAKIQGTFECMSNIQLWMTPERDFGIFFPILHIILLTAITGSAWLAAVVAFHLSWQMMHMLTIGTMAFVVLVQLLLCQPWCPMPQRMPLKGIDISTGLLISLLMLMISYILVYGDRLMWFFSPTLRWLLALSLILLAFILYRLKTFEQPYISLEIFKYKNVLAILFVTAVAELLLGAEHTLEEIYWTEVRGLEEHTKGALCLWSLPGVYAGVLITLYWLGHARWKVWKLFAIGFGCILVYSMWMYFYLDVNVPIEQYRLGLAFRGCAYAILAVSLMWSLHESVHDLQHFFMALFIFNVIHMYLAGASGYGLYTTLFKHFMADNMARYGAYLTLTGLTSHSGAVSPLTGAAGLTLSVMSVTLKQIFGQMIWVSGFMTFAFLLLDIPRVRTGIEKVPYWPVYGIKMLSRLRTSKAGG